MDENNNDKPLVLIIEDDPFILDILVFKFNKKEWRVISAMDGEAGLKKAAEEPNIILLDILLPGISGYEVLEQLKADPTLKDIPVLVLSNYGQKEEIEKSISLGAVDHLVKSNIITDIVVTHAHEIIKGGYVRKEGANDLENSKLES